MPIYLNIAASMTVACYDKKLNIFLRNNSMPLHVLSHPAVY